MRPLSLKTVVVATDLDQSSLPALLSAHLLAQAAGATLHVAHACEGGVSSQATITDRAAVAVDALLRRAGVPSDATAIHLIPGAPVPTIRSLADRLAADTIVLGPPHHDRAPDTGRPLGRTARALVDRTYVPILITPRALTLPLHRVLVPVDLSETARGALLVAITWASALRSRTESNGTRVAALHVAAPGRGAEVRGAASAELDAVRARAGRWAGVAMEERLVEARDPARAIVEQAAGWHADLVVLGTRGAGADEAERLGSVSAAVVCGTEAPTLLVPPGVWQAFATDGSARGPATV